MMRRNKIVRTEVKWKKKRIETNRGKKKKNQINVIQVLSRTLISYVGRDQGYLLYFR
jgi:hypothetical protein